MIFLFCDQWSQPTANRKLNRSKVFDWLRLENFLRNGKDSRNVMKFYSL